VHLIESHFIRRSQALGPIVPSLYSANPQRVVDLIRSILGL
jgi:hypothetical protein